MRYSPLMMKKLIVALLSFLCFSTAHAQSDGGLNNRQSLDKSELEKPDMSLQLGEFYYKQALEKAEAGDLDKALELFDKSISIKGDEYVAWYNRGIVKSMMGRYEDALADLEQSLKLNSGYKKAYLNRGNAKMHLTDYGGAIVDYTRAIQLDSAYGEAFYDRGLVYELFDKMDVACNDFIKAKQLAFAAADKRVNVCLDISKRGEIHPILWLKQKSESRRYGFAPENPVKVGAGPDGGTANERAYLQLLRDPKGKPVKFEKISSCCGYSSKNAPKGLAMVDKYEMTFTDETGNLKTVFIYISFYDYEDPQIPYGFSTVKEISSIH
jgi:tetratricopeptide (TPR) repeat protein